MRVVSRVLLQRVRLAASLSVFALAVLSAAPASAQSTSTNACTTSGGQVSVQFLQIGGGNGQIVAQPDGSFVGPLGVRVYCSLDDGDIPNVQVALLTSVPRTRINGQPASCANTYTGPATNIYIPDPTCAPVRVSLPTGRGTVSVSSNNPGLQSWEWFARVGFDQVTVLSANGQDVKGLPNLTGGIWAQTPELDSIALFGTGALGMAGYGLMRLRLLRRRTPPKAS